MTSCVSSERLQFDRRNYSHYRSSFEEKMDSSTKLFRNGIGGEDIVELLDA